ncbi:kinase-like domain-containing protein [Gautieria morchelliformis]|nr:kinase-like domain-containing protein [Gautieria morchelliformis]
MMPMRPYVEVERFFELKEALDNDDDSLTVVKDYELTHFTDIFRDGTLRNFSAFQRSKEFCIIVLLWNLSLTLSGLKDFLFQSLWPFQLLVAPSTSKPDNAREAVCTYTPRSVASLLVDGYPHMLMEIESHSDGYDRFRVLLQAACLVRLSNALCHTKKNPFIITAISIDSNFLATRYLVWQPENYGTDVHYSSEQFDLGDAHGAFDFVFQLYNLAACANMQHKYLRSKEAIIAATQRSKDLPSITSYNRGRGYKRGRDDDDESDDGQRSPKRSKNNGGANESMTGMDEVIVDAGYRVIGGKLGSVLPLSESMREGWSPSNRSFVFKLVGRESDELKILEYLKEYRGSEHHFIELHEVISDGLDNIIVLPRLTPLSDALRRLDKSVLATVPQQFLEGVAFMHRHNVAHLDLKTDNIVIERSGPSGRLTAYIIDFNCSMMVEGVETTIKDMYGTPGWMAPEVSATRSYSPILADRWACGNVLLQLGNHLKLSVELKKLSRELMSTDPRSRPVLLCSGIVPP